MTWYIVVHERHGRGDPQPHYRVASGLYEDRDDAEWQRARWAGMPGSGGRYFLAIVGSLAA